MNSDPQGNFQNVGHFGQPSPPHTLGVHLQPNIHHHHSPHHHSPHHHTPHHHTPHHTPHHHVAGHSPHHNMYHGLSKKQLKKRLKHEQSQLYDGIDHHINNTIYYKDKNTLHKIRVVLFTILAMNWISNCFVVGPVAWAKAFFFYTVWNETFVFVYFFCLVFLHPMTKRYSDLLVNFQHQVVTSQTIVVLVFWLILFPKLGLEMGGGARMIYQNSYKHTIPFLAILHELFVTYGLYRKAGIKICLMTFAVYSVWNAILCFGFDIVVYPTPGTDPHNLQAYFTIVIAFAIVWGVGSLYMRIKTRIVVDHFRGNFPGETAEILSKVDGGLSQGASLTNEQQVRQDPRANTFDGQII